METFDIVIIGAGAAGSTCVEKVSDAGKRVALIEREALGGTCLNYGCDPSKTALHTAKILRQAQHGDAYGLNIPQATVSWPALQQYIQETLREMRGGSRAESRQRMKDKGVELIMGDAQFVSAQEVTVNGRSLHADQILIATGMKAMVPNIEGLAEYGFITSKQVFDLPQLPRRLGIVGAGPIGVEFAQLFARLGSQVTLLEAESHILPQDDRELADELADILAAEGVTICMGAEVTAVSLTDGGKQLTFSRAAGEEETAVVDELLMAVGRQAAVDGLSLEAAGVEMADGKIKTDDRLRTTVPHIWAAGDVADSYPFTHMATRQGEYVAEALISKKDVRPFAPGPVPWVTFTDPELAHVGQTETQLQEQNIPYTTFAQPIKNVARAITMGVENGRIKLLAAEDGQILGGHILAPNGGELIAPILLAMQANVPIKKLATTIWPYPTLSEALGKAAQNN